MIKSGVINEIKHNEQSAEVLHKPIIKKFNRRRVYSSPKDNIWCVDLDDMLLISKCNHGIRFLLCVIDLFSKYAWVIPLKYKKGVTIVSELQNFLNYQKTKSNKI